MLELKNITLKWISPVEKILIKSLNIKIENSEIALLNFLQSLTANVEDLEAFNTFSQILTNSFMNRTIRYEGELYNKTLTSSEILQNYKAFQKRFNL